MRAAPLLVLLLLAPAVAASSSFAPRAGALDLSCTLLVYTRDVGGNPWTGCADAAYEPTAETTGAFVADLSWTPRQGNLRVVACLSLHREVVGAAGHAVWLLVDQRCEESYGGGFTVRLPAHEEGDRIGLSARLQDDERTPEAGFRAFFSERVAYSLRHEA